MKIDLGSLAKLVGGGMAFAAINPAQFNDPVALATEWSPLKGGGSNFKTHVLTQSGPDRLEFKMSKGALVFYLFLMLIGILSLAVVPVARHYIPFIRVGELFWGPILTGLLMFIIGLSFLRKGSAPIVFDRKLRAYWRGRTAPNELFNPAELKNYAPFDQIHAFQLIAEHIRKKSTYYYSYELNVVLADGSRLNVLDHANLEVITRDAEKIAAFTGKPLWNATTGFLT